MSTAKLLPSLAAVALIALAGCDNQAGQNVDEGGFGNPTMINTMAETGQAVAALQARFAAEVPTTINFAFDRATITPQAAAILDEQAAWIKKYPQVRFKVFGHTDLVGSAAYNYNLGLRRANAVVAYFASKGISRKRLVAVVSYGETQPVIVTQQPEIRNRRTVTEVTGFMKNVSGPLNGKYAATIWKDYIESATRPHPQNTSITSTTGAASGGSGG